MSKTIFIEFFEWVYYFPVLKKIVQRPNQNATSSWTHSNSDQNALAFHSLWCKRQKGRLLVFIPFAEITALQKHFPKSQLPKGVT